jgi:hypothetical protein
MQLTKGKITLLNNSYKRNENGQPNKEKSNKSNAIIEKTVHILLLRDV